MTHFLLGTKRLPCKGEPPAKHVRRVFHPTCGSYNMQGSPNSFKGSNSTRTEHASPLSNPLHTLKHCNVNIALVRLKNNDTDTNKYCLLWQNSGSKSGVGCVPPALQIAWDVDVVVFPRIRQSPCPVNK